ncbi:MAG: MTH1187 family thiamine-binding protein [Prolixibacteraceae bacterium]|nr:MTH1187 family thiamine-binding protein [Prolixibacteraceae bacterium]
MKNTINAAIQVLPQSETLHPYSIVDKAIEAIQKSGLKYRICPFETVVEGEYGEVMNLVKKIHETCYQTETDNMLVYLKIQSAKNRNVTIEDKMEKYDD